MERAKCVSCLLLDCSICFGLETRILSFAQFFLCRAKGQTYVRLVQSGLRMGWESNSTLLRYFLIHHWRENLTLCRELFMRYGSLSLNSLYLANSETPVAILWSLWGCERPVAQSAPAVPIGCHPAAPGLQERTYPHGEGLVALPTPRTYGVGRLGMQLQMWALLFKIVSADLFLVPIAHVTST